MTSTILQVLSGGTFITAICAAIAGLWRYFTGRGRSRIDAVAEFQKLSWSEVENLQSVLLSEREERKNEKIESQRRNSRFEQVVVKDVPPLIDFADANGAGEVPAVSEDLRDMLSVIRYQTWEEANPHE